MTVLEALDSGTYTYGLPEKLEADLVSSNGDVLCYVKYEGENWEPLYNDDTIAKDYLDNNKTL